jgi:hypothetical protein
MIAFLAKDIAQREKIMYVAPLAVLSYIQATTDSEDVVLVSRVTLEALLRSAFPGFSAGDFDVASCLRAYSDMAPIVEDLTWRTELTHMVQPRSEDGIDREHSTVVVEWFDDVAQAIDSGAISDAPLTFIGRPC